ncbi:MAG: hypothetical protein Crog4KO_09680 [Crocinitomicaceae bacterium]
MIKQLLPFLILFLTACNSEESSDASNPDNAKSKPLTAVEKYYQLHANDSLESKSIGSVGNGSIEHATLIPFEGSNYSYFDKTSYLGGRAFTHSKVAQITVDTYEALEKQGVDRHFKVMEFSRKEGGKIFPHRTHQNGLSVDYMMPLQKDGKPYYELDKKGASHYLLEFDADGNFSEDAAISIDFDMAAKHILELDKQARKNGMRIHKVIFNTHLKDELFASKNGKTLRNSGIYVTRNLSKIINDLHDDHYHVDFIRL